MSGEPRGAPLEAEALIGEEPTAHDGREDRAGACPWRSWFSNLPGVPGPKTVFYPGR